MLEWIIPGAAAALAGYGFLIVPTQWLKLERIRHPIGLNKKILQISDIHVEKLRISPRRLERTIREEAPDWISLTGDFTRKTWYLPRLEPYLKVISAAGVPVYAVLGNHDYKMKSGMNRLLELLSRYGITLLRNEALRLPDCTLVGIDNFGTGHSKIGKAFRHTNPADTIIVLTHDPNLVPHIGKRYDYLMSGHLHGKQLNIPFFFRFKPKGELPAQGIYKGLHRSPQGAYYISKGIGQAGVNARFMVRSEVTVHEL